MTKKNKAGLLILDLLFTLYITTPTEADVYDWLESEHGITQKDETRQAIGAGHFKMKDTRIQEMSSHYRHAPFFSSTEKDFYYENGESFTIRLLGIANQLVPMEDSELWEWLN